MTHSIIEIKVRGYHIDAFGVVNHAWFIRLFFPNRLNDLIELVQEKGTVFLLEGGRPA